MDKSIGDALVALNFKKVFEEIDQLKENPLIESIPGPKGDRGVPGRDGTNGRNGKDGVRGPKGDKGDRGDPGAPGRQGDKGDPGENGRDGINGKDGRDGIDGKDGLQGPKGDKGDKGDPGENGSNGLQGPKGDQGQKGDAGKDGRDGTNGLNGIDGAQGPKGDKGDPGSDGRDGADGKDGRDGINGKDGLQGPKGDKGDRGDQGPAGKDAVVPDITPIIEKGVAKAQDDFNRWRENVNRSLASIGGGGLGKNDVIKLINKLGSSSNTVLDSASLATITQNILSSNISYNNLVDKPFIPSDVSQLTDSSGLLTTGGGSGLDSAAVTAIVQSYNYLTTAIDSADVASIISSYGYTTYDSADTLELIDSAYIRLRQTPQNFAYSSLTGAPSIPTTVTVNGTSITLGSSGTITAAAGTLTGSTLASGVTTSSLTSVGTLTGLTVNSTSSTPVSITADGRPGSETNTWSFVSNQNVGGPRAWIQFPDNTIQATAWTGTYSYNNLTELPTLFSGSYNDLTDTPTLFSGSYTDLTDKPTIPTTVTVNGTSITLGSSGTVTAAAGTLTGSTLASGVTSSSLTSVGTLTGVTSNAATAFTAGDAAISGVALQIPTEGAIRNLTNGSTNMYFDVSNGGSTNGQFTFRSSNAFTNVLTMSPTAATFNSNAVVTARTPSLARSAFNSALDSEITIDNMRFRVSNQGGIFPQVIGNGSSRNLAWTSVGAVNGSAINQAGSTGTIVADNAWTTLYNLHGMDAAGDTITVTLQDKALGAIYRITFMRSDNGSTTGYNIIAERLI